MKLIDKDAVLSEIKTYKDSLCDRNGNLENIEENSAVYDTLSDLEKSIDDLEVVDPYAESIQYDSIKAQLSIIILKLKIYFKSLSFLVKYFLKYNLFILIS